jgi:hypothetical protein
MYLLWILLPISSSFHFYKFERIIEIFRAEAGEQEEMKRGNAPPHNQIRWSSNLMKEK